MASPGSFDAFSNGEAGCAESMPAPSVGTSSRSTSRHRHAGLSSLRGTRLRSFSCSVVTVPARRRPACHFTVTTVLSPLRRPGPVSNWSTRVAGPRRPPGRSS